MDMFSFLSLIGQSFVYVVIEELGWGNFSCIHFEAKSTEFLDLDSFALCHVLFDVLRSGLQNNMKLSLRKATKPVIWAPKLYKRSWSLAEATNEGQDNCQGSSESYFSQK